MKSEKIGKITLDYTCYSGTDLYCDGDIEQEILDIVKSQSSSNYTKVIEERANWPILYHLSPLRENIVKWLPAKEGARILEVGSGCGAITGALSEKAGHLDCVDLSKQRSLINAYRHKDCANVVIHVGNFQDIEPTLPQDYDVICLIGVFEYGQAYIGGEHPYEEFLKILKRHLAPGGQLVIAIESRLGLKYFAGCREDHLGTFFSGIEGYSNDSYVRTFTRRELLEIAETCGFVASDCHMYYPYPDYKFMHTLFSDKRLPKVGELKDNIRNFDRNRYALFDEKLVFDTLIREQQFPLFSNSYLLVLGPAPEVDYARFSNDRDASTQIVTMQLPNGDYCKKALSVESAQHLQQMEANCNLLKKRYDGSKLQICDCHYDEENGGYIFPFVEGRSLEALLDDALDRGDNPAFTELVLEFASRISCGEDMPITDMDMIFSNIIVSEKQWTVIDYEWVVSEKKSVAEQVLRALYCYQLEDEKRRGASLDAIYDALNISDYQMTQLERSEALFQQRVTDGHRSLGEMREAIGNEVMKLPEMSAGGVSGGKARLQVYPDTGEGFCEESSFFPRLHEDGYEMELAGNTRAVRLDPCDGACLVKVEELLVNGEALSAETLQPNGSYIAPGLACFKTEDPGFVLSLRRVGPSSEQIRIKVRFTVLPLPETMKQVLPDYSESLAHKLFRKVF